MIYWVTLESDGQPVQVDPHTEGGIYLGNGNDLAQLLITGNYASLYFNYLDQKEGLNWLDEKQSQDVLLKLNNAITVLGVEKDSDYWAPTAGNAGYALAVLRDWAILHPGAVFRVL